MMELNREQIIKALECCSSETASCTGCPRFPSLMGCSRQNMRDALSLIKELTEENKAWQMQLISQEERAGKAYYDLACEVEDLRAIAEQYQKQFEDCAEDRARLTEENERLRAQVKMWTDTAYCEKDRVNSIKADTVRKMVEKINASFHPDSDYEGYLVKECVEQIAKEMKGEDNG